MDSSGGEEPGSSNQDSGAAQSQGPVQPPLAEPKWTASSLPPEFAQRLVELRHIVHGIQGGMLTLAEQQAVASLIQSLRAILDAGNQM